MVRAIQPLCEFEEGELRVISVEGQPLFGETMHWAVYDAASGEVANGETQMSDYEEHQPWPVGDVAKALE